MHMDPRDIGLGKDRFYKVYANLPINLRNEIVAVVDGAPVTWNVAYLEINAETPLGTEILRKLVELNLI
jgi:hypothetical protein